MTKDEILGRLPDLDVTALEQIVAVAQSLINDRAMAADVPLAKGADLIYEALKAVVGSTMALHNLPAGAQKQFNTKLPQVTRYLNINFRGWEDNQITQLAFLKAMFDLLRKDIFNITGHKPTTMMMIQNMHRLPEVINESFPGYLTSELGELILKQFMK